MRAKRIQAGCSHLFLTAPAKTAGHAETWRGIPRHNEAWKGGETRHGETRPSAAVDSAASDNAAGQQGARCVQKNPHFFLSAPFQDGGAWRGKAG